MKYPISLLNARPGDRVVVRLPAGLAIRGGKAVQEYAERTGKVILTFPDRLILNMGGRYGTPAVATTDNIVKVIQKKGGV